MPWHVPGQQPHLQAEGLELRVPELQRFADPVGHENGRSLAAAVPTPDAGAVQLDGPIVHGLELRKEWWF